MGGGLYFLQDLTFDTEGWRFGSVRCGKLVKILTVNFKEVLANKLAMAKQ